MLENKSYKLRIKFLISCIVLAGGIVVVRLFFLQIIEASDYKERAKNQYVAPVSDSFDRGNIYFTNKDGSTMAAATVMNGSKLAINPGTLDNPQETYDALNKIVAIDRPSFLEKANKKNDPYEEIADKISQEDTDKITNLKLKGVTTYREKWRFYPADDLAAKVIGFVSYRDDKLTGSNGLEYYYNDVLSRDDNDLYVNFFAQIFANIKNGGFKNNVSTGDLVTSIEPVVQTQLEKIVKDIQEKWGSEEVGGVLMNPQNGEIIAMAAVPTFNLNAFGSVKDASVYNNPFVQSRYEMGSIVKPLIMAGAIDKGVVTPSTTYDDKGSVDVNGTILNNFDKRGRGIATMQDVLNQSLNTGMVFVEQKMGKKDFKDLVVNSYKLGEKTGIDLPAEVNGSVANLNGLNDINYATAAFGQGIATSPINIVRGFASLANGGYLVTPHIGTNIIEASGDNKTLEYPKSEEAILKPETISTIRNMLIKVVDDGYHLGLDHYTVAAKTGTAQIARPDGQGYYNDRNLHSFIGFFPANNPRFVLYLFNLHPKGVKYAIQSLGTPFFDMVKFLDNYYEIPPDR